MRWREVQALFYVNPERNTCDYDGRKLRKGCKELCGSLVDLHQRKDESENEAFLDIVHQTAREYESSPPDAFDISNIWVLLRYIVDHGLVNMFSQHSDLTACCLEYLGSSPLALSTSDEEVEERLKEGYFAFHEYASVYWFHHLLYVNEHRFVDDSDFCTRLADRFRKFVERYATAESIQLSEVSGHPAQILSLLKKVPEKATDRNKCFDIEWRTLRIRRQLECLAEHLGPGTAERRSIHVMYGMRLFKCPKLDCKMFLEGFATRALRDKHIDQHDRPYLCVRRGCPFQSLGFETGNQLERHIKNAHITEEDSEMLFPPPPRKHPDTLCKAAARGDVVALKTLLKQGADVNQTSRPKGGETPLFMAAQKSRLQACKILLEAGADLNFIGPSGTRRTTALHAATANADIEMVQYFLAKEDVNANILNGVARTPISLAAGMGKVALVKILIASNKVNANERIDGYGRTVLNHASQSDEMIELLIPHVSQEVILESVFNEIVCWGTDALRLLKVLLRFDKIDVNARNREGYSLLHAAIKYGDWEFAKLLIQQPKIDLNSIDREGVTPLYEAIATSILRKSGEAEDIIKMLLASKCVVPDAPDNQGQTPLSKAAEGSDINLVRMLIATGSVNLNGYDHQGRTPLSKAMEHDRKEVVEALLETGKIELNARDSKGETMLSRAIQDGRMKEIEWLMTIDGVDFNAINAKGQTAGEYAEDLYKIVGGVTGSALEGGNETRSPNSTPGFKQPLQEHPNTEMRESPSQGTASSSDVIQKQRNYASLLHPMQTQLLEQQHDTSGNHGLRDYEMQLMLLEQQSKKRALMVAQEPRKKVLDMLVAARDRQQTR